MHIFRTICATGPAIFLLFTTGCATKPEGTANSGGPGSAVAITSKVEDRWLLEDAVIEVFRANGYRSSSRFGSILRFHKTGDRATQAIWSDLRNPNDIIMEATVEISPVPGGHRIACQVSTSQSHAVRGEQRKDPVMFGALAYRGMLRDADKLAQKRVNSGEF